MTYFYGADLQLNPYRQLGHILHLSVYGEPGHAHSGYSDDALTDFATGTGRPMVHAIIKRAYLAVQNVNISNDLSC